MNSTACSPKIIIPDLYNHHHHPIARCEKNRRRAVSYVSTGLACLPRDTNASHIYRRRAVVYVIPRFANNLYNRSSAVDSFFYNQPQVGKPTWGYNYPTVLRRLPPTSARCEKTAIIIRLRQWRDAKKTAEERFNMLARGWLAYPVTPMHAHLPPKSGCRNPIPACANGALLLVTPSARRDSGGRMGHRRTPSLCASEMRYFPLSARRIPIEKTAIHLPIHRHRRKPPKSGLIC